MEDLLEKEVDFQDSDFTSSPILIEEEEVTLEELLNESFGSWVED